MTEKKTEDALVEMMAEATAGIRQGLKEALMAHLAAMIGGEFSISTLAAKVFNQEDRWSKFPGAKNWLESTILHAVEREATAIMEEWITDHREELRLKVVETLTCMDVAGKIAERVIKRMEN